MKRSTAGLAAALVIGGGLASATTSSNTLPASTAGFNAVTVTGGTMKSISYTTASGVITGFTVQLKGPAVYLTTTLFSTVTARFGSGLPRPCVIGLYNAALDQTPALCTGFAQPAGSSWTLTVTVS